MTELEHLIEQEKYLNGELSENRTRQREINTLEFCQKYGASIGDTIKWMQYTTEKTGVIIGFNFYGVKPAQYRVNLFKADGKKGKKEVLLYMSDIRTLKSLEVIKKAN